MGEVMLRLKLSRVPAVLFLALWNAQGRTMTHDLLADMIEKYCWGNEPGATAENVKNAKRQLQAKINDLPLRIESVRGIGYRLIRLDPEWDWHGISVFDFSDDEFHFKEG